MQLYAEQHEPIPTVDRVVPPSSTIEVAQPLISALSEQVLDRLGTGTNGGKNLGVVLHPTPYTLHPYTLRPTPYTQHPTPYTLHPYTLRSTPDTLHSAPYFEPLCSLIRFAIRNIHHCLGAIFLKCVRVLEPFA